MISLAYSSHLSPIDIISQFVTRSLSRGVIYGLVARVFHLYFDIQWTKASQNGQWIQYIDLSHVEANWFAKNRAKWGNVKWTVRYFWGPLYIISVLLIAYVYAFLSSRSPSIYASEQIHAK